VPNPPHTAEAYAKTNGIELCYDTFGDPGAPPILLIMGLAAQMIAWDEGFCTQLAARGYWVVRFDNRDAGRSTRLDAAGTPNVAAAMMATMQGLPVQAPYLLSDMADDVIGLMEALDIAQAHVVGASMGGAIAQTLAIEHPERIRTLTSIMSTTSSPDLPAPTPDAMKVLFTPAPLDLNAYLENYVRTWNVLRAAVSHLDEARDLDRARRIFERGINPSGVARQMLAMIASGSRKKALASVKTPTLILHGDADPLVPLACGIDTAQSIPGSKLVILKGMGHAIMIPFWPEILDAIVAHAVP
jgi:pimeloyl-ACP methyl ester carboxylesterase